MSTDHIVKQWNWMADLGRVNWKRADSSTGERPASKNPNDYIALGFVERPTTLEEKARIELFHGMLMRFPTEDVAAFVLRWNPNGVEAIKGVIEELQSMVPPVVA